MAIVQSFSVDGGDQSAAGGEWMATITAVTDSGDTIALSFSSDLQNQLLSDLMNTSSPASLLPPTDPSGEPIIGYD